MAKCRKPFKKGILEFGCGQCLPCRIKKRREWTHRLLLERLKHGHAAFVTLTYRFQQYGGLDANSGTLDPEHVQLWLKRLRERSALKVRYFLVGEYGDDSQRPHYHVALFGYPTCLYGRSRYSAHIKNCCTSCDLIRDTWRLGHIDVGSLTASSAQYVAGYVTKKMTRVDDPRLFGRFPEFARMSRKPGIGAPTAPDIASQLATDGGSYSIAETGDVPATLHHGGKSLPLGRYLRSKIREAYGFSHTGAQEGWALQATQEVRDLHEKAQSDPEGSASGYKKMVESKMQALLNLEAKHKLHSKRRRF